MEKMKRGRKRLSKREGGSDGKGGRKVEEKNLRRKRKVMERKGEKEKKKTVHEGKKDGIY